MMMTNARDAYLDASVATASPARLLVMLYDRLVLDVQRALDAQRAGDHEAAHRQLLHAQDDRDSSSAVSLRPRRLGRRRRRSPRSTTTCYPQLVHANVQRDVDGHRALPAASSALADAWREAALSLPHGGAAHERRDELDGRSRPRTSAWSWEVELDRLELEVIRIERLLVGADADRGP